MTIYEIISVTIAAISVVVAIVSIVVSYKTKNKCDKYINVKIDKNDGNVFGNVEGDINVKK